MAASPNGEQESDAERRHWKIKTRLEFLKAGASITFQGVRTAVLFFWPW